MFQLPVNNLPRIRKARKKVKRALEDIGLEFCKEAAEEFKEFSPDEQVVKSTQGFDICSWDPSCSKTQEYRSKPFCCQECQFSSKFYSGYKNHFRNVHRKLLDGKLLLNCPYCAFTATKKTLEVHVKIFHAPNQGQQNYGMSQGTALGAQTKSKNALHRILKSVYFCKKCTFRDSLYNVVKRHIYREHFQHVVSPYLGMASDKSVKGRSSSVNGSNIYCKQCQFTTRMYEALVQHVLEFHERVGSHVTNMIGHANVLNSVPHSLPTMNQNAQAVAKCVTPLSDAVSQPVIGYLKPVAPVVENPPTVPSSQALAVTAVNSPVAENNQTNVNTSQTQKWKICTVCNELFPENLYSAHFENAHKAKKVWALAKYIMKIHNFTSKCLLCNRYLPSSTLLNHMLTHGLTCPQCHSSFHGVHQIVDHVAQTHPGEFVGPVGASPLTFDLSIKQGQSRNIQLSVLTFNMKNSVNGQDQSTPAPQNAAPPPRPVIAPPAKIVNKYTEPKSLVALFHNSGGGKTVCPLCFSILKGTISDVLGMHLRERHQVLQTMHPVEKRMTYKCIHCLGVYTSNMVASTITLHLVQCRAVGRSQVSQNLKSPLTPKSPAPAAIKRQLPLQSTPTPKKTKTSKDCGSNHKIDGLVLDPTGYEVKTFEARKKFLTSYFNERPYPNPDEELKLSESLMMWRSEVTGHFVSKRNICFRSFKFKKPAVRLGFNMHALNELKHDLEIDHERRFGNSALSSASGKSTDCKPNNTLKLNTCPETISIDSDSDEETGKPNPNADNLTEETTIGSNGPPTETSSCEEENDLMAPLSENGESLDQEDLTKNTNDPVTETSSCLEKEENIHVVQITETVESNDQDILGEKTVIDTTDLSTMVISCQEDENEFMAPLAENGESLDQEDLTKNTNDPVTETSSCLEKEENIHVVQITETVESNDEDILGGKVISCQEDENEFMAPLAENGESLDEENLTKKTKEDTNNPSAKTISCDEGKGNAFMAPTDENVESKDQEIMTDEMNMETDDSSTGISYQEEQENVLISPTDERVQFKDQEILLDEMKHTDSDDRSTETGSCQDGKENVCMASC
nr:activity-dependent neuroprotective protein a [Nothobranchius furzeri]